MSVYSLYDVLSVVSCLVLVSIFVDFGVIDLLLTHRWVQRLRRIHHPRKHVAGFYFGAIAIFGYYSPLSAQRTGPSPSGHDVINVQSFGALGNGVHDDTAAIQAALAALQPGQTLYFPSGTYLQGTTNGDDARFIIQNRNNLTILGNNATIAASPSMSNSPKHSGFWILNSSNITINGISYDGRLDVRTPTQDDTPPTNMQNAFAVYDHSSNIIIENSKASRSMMDGFFVGVGFDPHVVPVNVKLLNDISTYNYRQGLSVVGVNHLLVSGGQYSFTGSLGKGKGTPPKSGIDLECDSKLRFTNANILMENLTVTGNSGVGVSFATKTIGAHLTNSTISNNAAAGVTMSADSSKNRVDHSTFFGNRYLGNWWIKGPGNSEANNRGQMALAPFAVSVLLQRLHDLFPAGRSMSTYLVVAVFFVAICLGGLFLTWRWGWRLHEIDRSR